MNKKRICHGSVSLAVVICGILAAQVVYAQSYSRTETITYHDNTSIWVLGQVASRTIDGVVAEQTTYDAATALPLQSRSFGKLKQTLTYNADSTVATVKDGNNNVTTLSGWKRGIPQLITFADGKTRSAVVNDNGWITRVTDENGFPTNYSYDVMGRLASIAYPIGDAVAWSSSSQSFVQVTTAEYGIPAGHWRQTVTTGNGVRISYYDAFWQPLLVREYDSGDVAGTQRFTGYEYDHEGRVVFASYPSSTSNPDQGTWTAYDAIGRVRSVARDSEQGLLTTTTSYLSNASGPYTLVTLPGGGQTRTWYQMFDQPSYDAPVKITHPEGAVTTINRDVFGKPTSIARGNSNGSVQATRSYTYNANQELCRVVEPETGATLMGYDGAGNLSWSAGGLGVATACHATGLVAGIQSRRVARTYDIRNRLKNLTLPDGNGNQSWIYTADGLPQSVTTLNTEGASQVTNSYIYNKRRLLTQETQNQVGELLSTFTYGYNANGHLSSVSYPSGELVDYAPNALGQPSKAGAYATGVSYFPNGGIKQFYYGNGIRHTLTQNARGLPLQSCDSYGTCGNASVLNDTYAYDVNGNVSQVTDGRTAGRSTRSMTYDGLDRLKSVTSTMFGNAAYTYDVLDNLTRATVGATSNLAARDHFYCYDSKWQLTNVKTGGCNGASVIGLSYDVQGNLANKSGTTHAFDYGNRLRSVSYASGLVESYRYDGHGRRVWSNNGGLLQSMYSNAGELLYQRNERTGKATDYIMLNGDLVASVERQLTGGTGTVKYQHTDALGSPVAVTNASRTIIETSEYEPFGRVGNRAVRDGAGYTGHAEDAATGLTYMQQRYYDPMLGRFLSVDPVTAYRNPMGSFNRYWYANNNPYTFEDPDGRSSVRTGSRIRGGGESSRLDVVSVNSRTGKERFNPARSGYNGRSLGADSVSRITADGTLNPTTENVMAAMRHFDIDLPFGMSISGGFAGGSSGAADYRDRYPNIEIGGRAFQYGLPYLGNVINHELFHGREFQLLGNLKGVEDQYMREIRAHFYNLRNPVPGTSDWEIYSRRRAIEGYFHHLTPQGKKEMSDAGFAPDW